MAKTKCQSKNSTLLVHRLYALCQPPKTHVIALLMRPGHTNAFDQIFQFLYPSDDKICYSHFPGLGEIHSGQGVLEGGLIWQHLWT